MKKYIFDLLVIAKLMLIFERTLTKVCQAERALPLAPTLLPAFLSLAV